MDSPKRFSNLSVAETITELPGRHSSELNAVLEAIESRCGGDEFAVYRDAIEKLMAAAYDELLEPIWSEFPELSPIDLTGLPDAPAD